MTRAPDIPEQWPARHADKAPNQGHSEGEVADAARRAMQPQTQALAGSAEGVGSVEFDDPGAFDVTEKTRASLAPEGRQERPAEPSAFGDGAPAPNVTGAPPKPPEPA
jgi:hypothetical protein